MLSSLRMCADFVGLRSWKSSFAVYLHHWKTAGVTVNVAGHDISHGAKFLSMWSHFCLNDFGSLKRRPKHNLHKNTFEKMWVDLWVRHGVFANVRNAVRFGHMASL